jgi:hypothetical protein
MVQKAQVQPRDMQKEQPLKQVHRRGQGPRRAVRQKDRPAQGKESGPQKHAEHQQDGHVLHLQVGTGQQQDQRVQDRHAQNDGIKRPADDDLGGMKKSA